MGKTNKNLADNFIFDELYSYNDKATRKNVKEVLDQMNSGRDGGHCPFCGGDIEIDDEHSTGTCGWLDIDVLDMRCVDCGIEFKIWFKVDSFKITQLPKKDDQNKLIEEGE